MALPTKTEILQNNYNGLGSPWGNIVLNQDIAINTNTNLNGSPWSGIEVTDVVTPSVTENIESISINTICNNLSFSKSKTSTLSHLNLTPTIFQTLILKNKNIAISTMLLSTYTTSTTAFLKIRSIPLGWGFLISL